MEALKAGAGGPDRHIRLSADSKQVSEEDGSTERRGKRHSSEVLQLKAAMETLGEFYFVGGNISADEDIAVLLSQCTGVLFSKAQLMRTFKINT